MKINYSIMFVCILVLLNYFISITSIFLIEEITYKKFIITACISGMFSYLFYRFLYIWDQKMNLNNFIRILGIYCLSCVLWNAFGVFILDVKILSYWGTHLYCVPSLIYIFCYKSRKYLLD